MSVLKPFAALRPKPELAAQICELPYDVMSSEEARTLAAGNPLSFLHVSKPEIDLPAGTDVHAPEVYAKGKENFDRLMTQGALKQDAQPCFYLYRQVMGGHAQTGLVAAASCEEYLNNIIKKHEFTRPDKEDDRVRHIETLNSQTGPVFLTYKAVKAMDDFVAKKTAEKPDVDFTGKDGVRHTSWSIGEAADIKFIEEQFAKIPHLYIADGHHRSAAAGRVYKARKEDGKGKMEDGASRIGPSDLHPLPLSHPMGEGGSEASTFLTVIFPHNQMQILPYNRVLKSAPPGLLQKLAEVFEIKLAGSPKPAKKHELSLYFEGKWHSLTFLHKFTSKEHSTFNIQPSSAEATVGRHPTSGAADPIEDLDVTLLQKRVLAPIFGIDDPRTSKQVNFVGGIRGTAELEKLVNSGEYACAFSMFPTSIEDLMSIADADGIMPPKSTWFEPKLRDAMFCHMI